MLLLALILAATSVASFNFSNSTYPNTTSISTSPILPSIVATTSLQATKAEPAQPCDSSRQDCLRPEEPFFDDRNGTYDNPYYNTDDINPNDNITLRDYCATAFDTSLSNWLETAQISYGSTPVKKPSPAAEGQVNASAIAVHARVRRNETSTASTDTEQQKSTGTASYVSQFTFTASQPCCYNCTVSGGSLQLFQWPTQTASPPTSTYVNNLGFAFTSPSVYVAFKTLYAADYCGGVGKRYGGTTLAFSPNDLSTAKSYTWDTDEYASQPPTLSVGRPVFTKADWGDTMDCDDIKESFWQPANGGTTTFSSLEDVSMWWSAANTKPAATFDKDSVFYYTVTYNPCTPTMSVPTGVYKIDPSWTACGRQLDGIWNSPLSVTATITRKVGPANTVIQIPKASNPTTRKTPTAIQPAATSTDTYILSPALWPFPTGTSINNPYTTGLPPTPKLPPEIESDVAPPAGNSGTGASGEGNFIQKTTIISFVSAVAEIESPPTTALNLGSQTLSVGQRVTNAGETYSLASNGDFIVGTQTLNPGQQITDSGTTYSRASNGATLVIAGSSYTSTQVLYTPAPTYSAFVIGTQTLRPGSQITASGTTYSLATNGATVIIDGTNTQVIGTITSSASLGGGTSGTSKGPASASTKKTSSSTRETSVWILASVLLICLFFILEL